MNKDSLQRWGISKIFDIKKYPFRKKKRNIRYYQESNGWCSISHYNNEGRCIRHETSDGFFIAREYDKEGNLIKLMDVKTWKREQLLNFLLEEN